MLLSLPPGSPWAAQHCPGVLAVVVRLSQQLPLLGAKKRGMA